MIMRYLKPTCNTNFFDNDFEDFFKPMLPKEFNMHTDIKETKDSYILEMNVPGFKKEDIDIDYEKGYLTVTAKKEEKETEKKEDEHKYIRRERYTGYTSRKFYIGDIDEKDIVAKLEDGVLTLSFPKESKKEETKKKITIA